MDLARISGMKVEELKNFLRLRGLRTCEEVELPPQNSLHSQSAWFIEIVYSGDMEPVDSLKEAVQELYILNPQNLTGA